MPHIDRSHTGQRRYSNRDLDWLDFVGKLRLTGMPVADMVRYAELVREGDDTFGDRFELLEATREDVLARIAELRGHARRARPEDQFLRGRRAVPWRRRGPDDGRQDPRRHGSATTAPRSASRASAAWA